MLRVAPLLFMLAFVSHSNAGLIISDAGGESLSKPQGTTNLVLELSYVNDTGTEVTFLGAEVLDFEVNVSSFYQGSGAAVPTLDSPNPDLFSTPLT